MKILVVEDQFKLARSLKRGLEQDRFVVEVARDYESGLQMVAGSEHDLIILDRMMPGGDGLDIVRWLRENQRTTPCIMLTAKSQVEARVEGLNSGADDYLVKPFSFDELLARVYALLRRPDSPQATALSARGVVLDSYKKTTTYNNQVIDLTKKEFNVLEYLLRNKGKVVSKETLLNHVWDFDADVLPNTVEAFINSIRKKIDKNYNIQLIKTVRGHGYTIEE
ncbi:TPA: response regulator transcription factor [Candidatus Saccharibacteria bacterium]|nr:response regulator transcription factor [Candidatus Saccharibacteria bacterium]HIO88002.1 response regulator transcription factor [Candidatus Saccharibacteria bacterium]